MMDGVTDTLTPLVAFLNSCLDQKQAELDEWLEKRFKATASTALSYDFGRADTVASIITPRRDGLSDLAVFERDAANWLANDIIGKRRIIALHEIRSWPERWGDVRHHPTDRRGQFGQLTGEAVYGCVICDSRGPDYGTDELILVEVPGCATLLAVAAPFSQYPGFRAEWAIEA